MSNETDDEMARRVYRETHEAIAEAFRQWPRDPLHDIKITPAGGPGELKVQVTLPGNIHAIEITDPDLFDDKPDPIVTCCDCCADIHATAEMRACDECGCWVCKTCEQEFVENCKTCSREHERAKEAYVPIQIPEEATRTPERWTLIDASKGELRYHWDTPFDGTHSVTIQVGPEPRTVTFPVIGAAERDNLRRHYEESLVNGSEIVNLTPKPLCPDCKGSGIYEGIISRGPCEKCGGSGRA